VSMNSAEPVSITGTPGMNLRESSLGVVSVWMNMDLAWIGLSDTEDNFLEIRDEEVVRVVP